MTVRNPILPTLLLGGSLALVGCANSGTTTQRVESVTTSGTYEFGGKTFTYTLVHPPGADPASLPGILMVPNWMGPTEAATRKAREIYAAGGQRHVVMVADMYGTDVRPTTGQEAGAAAGAVRGDRAMMRARAQRAFEVFVAKGSPRGLDPKRTAAIGFCFGGGTVLEWARSGADVNLVASFHGDLMSPTLAADARSTRAKVLVLHGADDPYVPQDDVQTWIETMRGTDVDWQIVQFADTVHSFTDPDAASEGARFNQRSNDRAFAMMWAALDEIWGE